MNKTRTALYYPEIIIPSKQFIRKTILYWDEIGSIVPKSIWDEHPFFELEDEETNQLKDAGIYRPFFPHLLKTAGIHDFEREYRNEFFKRLDFFNQRDLLRNNTHYTPIYGEKEMVPGLFEELQRRGLAQKKIGDKISVSESKHPLFFIESVTANIYMSILAEFLSDADENITMPVTEESTWRDYTYSAIDPNKKKVCANLILNRILPIPLSDVPLGEIIQFKDDHETELVKFRECIDNFQSSISSAKDIRSVQDSCCKFSEKFNSDVKDLERSLRDRNIETLFGSVQAILDVKSPEITTTLIGSGALALGTAQPLFALSGIALGASIKVEKYLLKEKTERRKWLESLPHSYVYHLKKSKLIKNETRFHPRLDSFLGNVKLQIQSKIGIPFERGRKIK